MLSLVIGMGILRGSSGGGELSKRKTSHKAMKQKPIKALREAPLIPQAEFEQALRTMLQTPKQQIDRQMSEFQASNKVRRASRGGAT
jgi:hypothetical protein